MELIGKAYFTISFGEGFDGYFNQPSIVGSVAFAVYNNQFFPDESWKELDNVFATYSDMEKEIVEKCEQLTQNKEAYEKILHRHKSKLKEFDNKEVFINNLKNFYNKNYTVINGQESEK